MMPAFPQPLEFIGSGGGILFSDFPVADRKVVM